MEPNWFFNGPGQKIRAEVVEACINCPVKDACLNHALKYEEYGYWSNTNPRQRVEMRKERGIVLEKIFVESQKLVDEDVQLIADAIASQKIKGRGRKPAACGTRSGYNAHLRRKKTNPKEVPCDACKRAQTDAIIATKRKQKEAKSNA